MVADCTQLARVPHTYTVGDTLPELVATETDGVDLTGFDIELQVSLPDDTLLTVVAIPVDLANGQYKFKFGPTDLVAGELQSRIQKVSPGGDQTTSDPFIIPVREAA